MKRFAVAYADRYKADTAVFDNNLTIEIVEANDWREAMFKHSKIEPEEDDDIYKIAHTIEEVKKQFWQADTLVDIVEIE